MRSRLMLLDRCYQQLGHFDKPGHRISGDHLIFFAGAKFGLPLSSRGVFKEFETRQQK